jgi:hypothetical protein
MENDIMTTPIKIKADIMWAYLDQRNEMSGKFQVDLCNLSPAAAQALTDMGIDVKTKDDKGAYITCKSNNVIRAFDSNGNPMEGISVGNGSKAIAVIAPYTWTFKNKEGVSPSLKKMVVTDLVSYEDGDVVSVDDDDDIL